MQTVAPSKETGKPLARMRALEGLAFPYGRSLGPSTRLLTHHGYVMEGGCTDVMLGLINAAKSWTIASLQRGEEARGVLIDRRALLAGITVSSICVQPLEARDGPIFLQSFRFDDITPPRVCLHAAPAKHGNTQVILCEVEGHSPE